MYGRRSVGRRRRRSRKRSRWGTSSAAATAPESTIVRPVAERAKGWCGRTRTTSVPVSRSPRTRPADATPSPPLTNGGNSQPNIRTRTQEPVPGPRSRASRGARVRRGGSRAVRRRSRAAVVPEVEDERSRDFGDAPRPGGQATGSVRGVPVEASRDRAEPRFPDVGAKRREPGPERAARLFGTAEDAKVGVREGAGEPGPDRSLVGGEVAVALRRPGKPAVPRVGGVESAEAERRQQLPAHGAVHGAGAVGREQVVREREGEVLVGRTVAGG